MAEKTWFREAAFGMFIHWGAYSVCGRGEWTMNRERIPFEVYKKQFAEKFLAENYRPEDWVHLAKEAGMKYMVLTAKHHDGFCLWNTKTTDYNACNIGPQRDLLKEYVDAVRQAGLKVGIYYSPADWSHPDYPSAYCRDWPEGWDDEEKRKRFVAFYTKQLRELMTWYGKIDLLWYDGCIPEPLEGERVNRMVKQLQPEILVNNRNGQPCDFWCSEQAIVPPKKECLWEACITLNGNWGYHSGDTDFKSPKEVVRMLIETAKDGGNLLLNVGPKPDGTIPKESINILKTVGRWLKDNGEAIYNVQRTPFSWGMSHALTMKGQRVYVHLYHELSSLSFAEIANQVVRVYRLRDGLPMRFTQDENGVVTIWDIQEDFHTQMVVIFVCEIKGEPRPLKRRTSFWIPGIEV